MKGAGVNNVTQTKIITSPTTEQGKPEATNRLWQGMNSIRQTTVGILYGVKSSIAHGLTKLFGLAKSVYSHKAPATFVDTGQKMRQIALADSKEKLTENLPQLNEFLDKNNLTKESINSLCAPARHGAAKQDFLRSVVTNLKGIEQFSTGEEKENAQALLLTEIEGETFQSWASMSSGGVHDEILASPEQADSVRQKIMTLVQSVMDCKGELINWTAPVSVNTDMDTISIDSGRGSSISDSDALSVRSDDRNIERLGISK